MNLTRRILRRLLPPPRPPVSPTPRRPGPTALPGDYRLADPALARLSADDLDPRWRAAEPMATLSAVGPDLWAFPLLRTSTCARLIAELDAIDAWCAVHHLLPERPNSMNRYGLILADFGLGGFVSDLREQVIAPLASRLFADCGGDRLDDHHAFIVEYQPQGDRDLGFHVDDAEVTLNLCLAGGFRGGELYFEGRRCLDHVDTASRPEESLRYAHQPGVALLHAGKHRHGALPIESGRRRNLIVWSRSAAARAREDALRQEGSCPDWCGA